MDFFFRLENDVSGFFLKRGGGGGVGGYGYGYGGGGLVQGGGKVKK